MLDKKVNSKDKRLEYVVYNNKLVAAKNASCLVENRGLNYGDGVFETMVHHKNHIRYFKAHWQRMQTAFDVLGLTPTDALNQIQLEKAIPELKKANHIDTRTTRVKLIIWRKAGGLYAANKSECNWLLTVKALEPKAVASIRAVVSKKIQLTHSLLSPLKTISALPYVLAGQERDKRKAEEIILLDQEGHVSEAGASNIWWMKDKVVYTPSLDSGCIDGTMRKVILRYCQMHSISIQTGLFSLQAMVKADLVFTSNVAGLNVIKQIDDHHFDAQHSFIQQLALLWKDEDRNLQF